MKSIDVIKRLPDMIAEVEALKGYELSNEQVGSLLKQLGESISTGVFANFLVPGFLAHDPACTSPPPPKNKSMSDVLCC